MLPFAYIVHVEHMPLYEIRDLRYANCHPLNLLQYFITERAIHFSSIFFLNINSWIPTRVVLWSNSHIHFTGGERESLPISGLVHA